MDTSLIIGATKGLGKELVRKMLSKGQHVITVGRAPADFPEGLSPRVRHISVDLLDSDGVAGMIENLVKEKINISYLVFCQRYRGNGDSWDGEMAVSLRASRQFIENSKGLFADSGDRAVVFVSSVFGDFVGEGQAISYHVAKAGLNQMMRYSAVNLGRMGIRANGVTPFTFLKDESKQFYLDNDKLMAMYGDIVPLGRMGTAEDSANVISFLCSSDSSFVNGQNIYVDGGLSVVWPETIARKLSNV